MCRLEQYNTICRDDHCWGKKKTKSVNHSSLSLIPAVLYQLTVTERLSGRLGNIHHGPETGSEARNWWGFPAIGFLSHPPPQSVVSNQIPGPATNVPTGCQENVQLDKQTPDRWMIGKMAKWQVPASKSKCSNSSLINKGFVLRCFISKNALKLKHLSILLPGHFNLKIYL